MQQMMRARLSPFSSLPSPGHAQGQSEISSPHHHHNVRLGAAPRQAGTRAGSLALHGMVVRPWGAGRARSVEEVAMGEGFMLLRLGGGIIATMGFGDHGQLAHGSREGEHGARVSEALGWAPDVRKEWEQETGPAGAVWGEMAAELSGLDWRSPVELDGVSSSRARQEACAQACARTRLPLLTPALIA